MAVWKMSEALYVVTCQKIGTPELVASRRDIVDIKELLENKIFGREQCSVEVTEKDLDYWHMDQTWTL